MEQIATLEPHDLLTAESSGWHANGELILQTDQRLSNLSFRDKFSKNIIMRAREHWRR